MELTEIKNSLIGYKKSDVCQYISEVNELHSAEITQLNEKINEIERQSKTVADENADLKAQIEQLKAEIKTIEDDKNSVCAQYDELLKETEELREKSDVISSAILKAEKCAENVIVDANEKAHEMIFDATEKVNAKARKLESAKAYISELRANVMQTLRKFDIELAEAENYAGVKKSDVLTDNTYSDSTKHKDNVTRDKFGVFKRA